MLNDKWRTSWKVKWDPETKVWDTDTGIHSLGVDNPGKSEVVKRKMKKTNMEKRGVEYSLQDKQVRELGKKNYKNKTGYDYPSQNPEVKEKAKQTNLKKRGVEYSSQDPKVKEKVKASFEATVKVYELLGAEVFLYFELDEFPITARVDPRTTARPGDTIKVAFDVEKIHVFDKETEQIITK